MKIGRICSDRTVKCLKLDHANKTGFPCKCLSFVLPIATYCSQLKSMAEVSGSKVEYVSYMTDLSRDMCACTQCRNKDTAQRQINVFKASLAATNESQQCF